MKVGILNNLYSIHYTQATIQQILFCCLQQHTSEKRAFITRPKDMEDPVKYYFLLVIRYLKWWLINAAVTPILTRAKNTIMYFGWFSMNIATVSPLLNPRLKK